MRRALYIFLLLALLVPVLGCARAGSRSQPTLPELPPETVSMAETIPTVPPKPAIVLLPPPEPVRSLSSGEKQMLLKIAMAERGHCGCTECIALVMCTILNRLDSGTFGSSLEVILSPEQFTPVEDGSYFTARPNENCYDALEMVLYGWDESQDALYYEWHTVESWHSRNLPLLFTHCDIKFYDKMADAQ